MRRSKIEHSFFLPDSIPGTNLKRMSKNSPGAKEIDFKLSSFILANPQTEN